MTTKQKLDITGAITGALTILSGIAYEKELIAVVPASWAPKVVLIGAIATVALKIWRAVITPGDPSDIFAEAARAAEAEPPDPPEPPDVADRIPLR